MERSIVLIAMFLVFPFGLFASPQMPDYIIYGNDTIATYNLILEEYLQRQDTVKTNQLFGLSFRNGTSFNCWRGYQAIYEIENDSLFLVEIINCGERRNGPINKIESSKKIIAIFGDKYINGKVFVNWFSGTVSFPLTDKLLRWDGMFYKTFEKEKIVIISKGEIGKTEDVENYVDDPNRIDRRDVDKVSDTLFEQLKRETWINANDFDCSTRYFVTIDENGNVSKVTTLYSDDELEIYNQKDEYNFCTDKIYNSLKSLHFDKIKDKGKPVSEDIYIEISINYDGKIKNMTH